MPTTVRVAGNQPSIGVDIWSLPAHSLDPLWYCRDCSFCVCDAPAILSGVSKAIVNTYLLGRLTPVIATPSRHPGREKYPSLQIRSVFKRVSYQIAISLDTGPMKADHDC